MAKVTPTTKSCNEICRMITGSDCDCYHKYVLTTFDPTSTHALYGVPKGEVDYWKNKIKNIGGKYIRVVSSHDKNYKIICFALGITPQELAIKQMEEEKQKRYEQALESKKCEIENSIICNDAGATNKTGIDHFAHYLLDGSLDPLLPYESYVLMAAPTNKDEKRVFDIVNKANEEYAGCVGMVTRNRIKMCELAKQMNKKITDEDKRFRRKAACLKYGLKFLAKCFEKPTA